MTAADHPSSSTRGTPPPRRPRLSGIARGGLARVFPPYARYRARQAATAATLARLQDDFEHIRKRHTEQIERLEDLVRELVLTAEAMRRGMAGEDAGED